MIYSTCVFGFLHSLIIIICDAYNKTHTERERESNEVLEVYMHDAIIVRE